MIKPFQTRTIFSYEDVSTIRSILKYMADGDKESLNSMDGVEIPDSLFFWPSLLDSPVTFIEPPEDFISAWQLQFVYSKSILLLNGPMWSKEEGQSDMILFIEKHLSGESGVLKIIDYRVS
jgi:hypothetical protein